jgi:hypothetical protein
MNIHPKKNFLKKIISIAGIASASLLLSFPAFALNISSDSGSKQLTNNRAYHTGFSVSSSNLLAQNNTGNQPSTTGGSNRTNQPSTTGGSNRVNDRYATGDSNRRNIRALTGGDSVRGFNWVCLNNPNPRCGT